MAPRSSTILRVILLFVIFCAGWYSLQIYIQLYGRFNKKNPAVDGRKDQDLQLIMKELNENELENADKEWKRQQNLFQPVIKKLSRNPCSTLISCSKNEFNFKLVTGAANAIGPSICLNGSIVMKNSMNNVDRGMNVAVFDGRNGKSLQQRVFDLFEKDSSELKNFLKGLKEEEIILVATADDAAHKLDDEAKQLLADVGSAQAKHLGFRDNWVFVGGIKIKHPSAFEKLIKNEKDKNKYGEWPEAISMEGCIPKLS